MRRIRPQPRRWVPLGRLTAEEFREVRLALALLGAERRWVRRDAGDWLGWHLRHLGQSWALLRLYGYVLLVRLLAEPPQGRRP